MNEYVYVLVFWKMFQTHLLLKSEESGAYFLVIVKTILPSLKKFKFKIIKQLKNKY